MSHSELLPPVFEDCVAFLLFPKAFSSSLHIPFYFCLWWLLILMSLHQKNLWKPWKRRKEEQQSGDNNNNYFSFITRKCCSFWWVLLLLQCLKLPVQTRVSVYSCQLWTSLDLLFTTNRLEALTLIHWLSNWRWNRLVYFLIQLLFVYIDVLLTFWCFRKCITTPPSVQ